MNLGEEVWKEVTKWNYFDKDTIGKQVVRSVDSVAANISEGYGRYHYKDSKKFYYYSRGSLVETQTWLEKAAQRNLVEREIARQIYKDLETLKKRLNAYIKSIGPKSETS